VTKLALVSRAIVRMLIKEPAIFSRNQRKVEQREKVVNSQQLGPRTLQVIARKTTVCERTKAEKKDPKEKK